MIVSTHRKREHTVESFNRKDYCHRFLTAVATSEDKDKYFLSLRFGPYWRSKFVVLFGACCMQLGVSIKDKDMSGVRYALYQLDVYLDARRQMEKAILQYKSNGDMWDFDRNEPSNVFLLAHISSILTATQCRTSP